MFRVLQRRFVLIFELLLLLLILAGLFQLLLQLQVLLAQCYYFDVDVLGTRLRTLQLQLEFADFILEFFDVLLLPHLVFYFDKLRTHLGDLAFEQVSFFLELDILQDSCMDFILQKLLVVMNAVGVVLIPARFVWVGKNAGVEVARRIQRGRATP